MFNSSALYQKLSIKKPIQTSLELLILILAISLLLYRLLHLKSHGLLWLLAFFSELCFTFDWFLYILLNWSPVDYKTYPQHFKQVPEVPPVDVLVTTADWKLEPSIMVVNTVLSLLAVDYPAGKLSCYVSDDGGSPVLLYALVEASNFAKIWVPFCKKYHVQVRAPFRYFSSKSPSADGHEFRQEEKRMKDEYERLCERIEAAEENPMVYETSKYYEAFKNTDKKNHPTIIKILLENKGNDSNGISNLVYVAREKRPNQPHYYKAGALNVLTRVSGVMTNAPFIVNIDCDMYVNNPNVVVEAMCILLGAEEQESIFVQFPQIFYNLPKDDPFGCQLITLFQTLLRGMAGIQGPLFGGCNCFHRRKTIYTLNSSQNKTGKIEENFGESEELTKSANEILRGVQFNGPPQTINLSTSIQSAYQVASADYENNTAWGLKVGWLYGSMTEDILTGIKIHSKGWKSVLLQPNPPAFLGLAPTGGPDALTQRKRWVTGSLEILVCKTSPLLAFFLTRLTLRQCLAYTYFLTRSLYAIPELVYVILPAYAILTNSHFLPSVQDTALLATFVPIFILYHSLSVCVYLQCGLSVRAWWNNVKMEMISTTSSYVFGILSLVLKLFGISEAVFEVTPKGQSNNVDDKEDDRNVGKFVFNESPLFIIGTAVVLLHLMALASSLLVTVGILQPPSSSDGRRGSGIGEILGCVWVLMALSPFLRGLFAKGKYGIPFPTICKSASLILLFVPFYKWLL
ncbi:hypothetical protein IC582_000464 [Cucumis melo]|uniref:Cellulose synthase-like protein B4 n=1 Tax=Cucumis melo TaxID=3656 RepID=A0A1S3C0Y0_CUCME|nr:cellulose synthase-like protein B4 [Cucumis melo]